MAPNKPITVTDAEVKNLPEGRYTIESVTTVHFFDVRNGVAERRCLTTYTLRLA